MGEDCVSRRRMFGLRGESGGEACDGRRGEEESGEGTAGRCGEEKSRLKIGAGIAANMSIPFSSLKDLCKFKMWRRNWDGERFAFDLLVVFLLSAGASLM